MKGRKFEVIIDENRICVDVKKRCVSLEKCGVLKHWAYILHHKNEIPHYHIYLDFGNVAVFDTSVAFWFGISSAFVLKLKSNVRIKDFFRYLLWEFSLQLDREVYAPSEIVANFDFEKLIAAS